MYREYYEQWLADAAIAEEDKAQLRALRDESEIEDRFYRDLSFGTAGMRGVLGIGRNRMNIYTVGRATQGLADALNVGEVKGGVAIAYDPRHQSEDFAMVTALVLCANSIPVQMFPSLRGVPQLSFAVRSNGCGAGVMITASHNPKQYNGYKVYGADGGQLGPEAAAEITKRIEAVAGFSAVKTMRCEDAMGKGLLRYFTEAQDEAYFAAVESLCIQPEVFGKAEKLRLVYTPLHGAGNLPVRRVLKDAGIRNLFVVEQQERPDPEFSTVSAPNPEAEDALDMAKALAAKKGADLILATDPDADRLGAAVCSEDGKFKRLSGNQIGCLLLDYILSQHAALGTLHKDAFVVKSIVSTNMANAICQRYGVEIKEVLTGFRYIAEEIARSEKAGKGSFLFGFEESFGYLAGAFVRDKDAICAALLLAEAAAYHCTQGHSLHAALEKLFEAYGYYADSVKNYTLYGVEGMGRIKGAMNALRNAPPQQLGGRAVRSLRDYQAGERTDLRTGRREKLSTPPSDVLYYELEGGAWLCARPSGTEPKLKLYANGKGESEEAAQRALDAMVADMEARLREYIAQ